jgi:O-antigen/teichoic acid export membrane protein
VVSTALANFDRPENASKAQVASAATTVMGLALLLRPYGIEGAAITSSISYTVALLVALWFWRSLKRDVLAGRATGATGGTVDSLTEGG